MSSLALLFFFGQFNEVVYYYVSIVHRFAYLNGIFIVKMYRHIENFIIVKTVTTAFLDLVQNVCYTIVNALFWFGILE